MHNFPRRFHNVHLLQHVLHPCLFQGNLLKGTDNFLFHFFFGFLSVLATKILHNLCSHFARQDGQDGKKRKENHTTKVTKIPKTKRRKYGMNETISFLNILITLELHRFLKKVRQIQCVKFWHSYYLTNSYLILCVLSSLVKLFKRTREDKQYLDDQLS